MALREEFDFAVLGEGIICMECNSRVRYNDFCMCTDCLYDFRKKYFEKLFSAVMEDWNSWYTSTRVFDFLLPQVTTQEELDVIAPTALYYTLLHYKKCQPPTLFELQKLNPNITNVQREKIKGYYYFTDLDFFTFENIEHLYEQIQNAENIGDFDWRLSTYSLQTEVMLVIDSFDFICYDVSDGLEAVYRRFRRYNA